MYISLNSVVYFIDYLFQIHFGGMSYDCELERGVRKHNIAPPRVVDLPKSATYNEIIKKGKKYFSMTVLQT